MEYIHTLPDGEELVQVDEADTDAIYEQLDPRGTSSRKGLGSGSGRGTGTGLG